MWKGINKIYVEKYNIKQSCQKEHKYDPYACFAWDNFAFRIKMFFVEFRRGLLAQFYGEP